ncbi:hypothetical protein P22_0756 [Propionispora sp. 2/2-37]|uniref:outer membrane beta-barrel protein n=1 Tax=Propionispora sp. 2/2-37 TaxID=1677858 RepID=UPI0006BB7911|nr:outer membrane beta-barrel protein [Propionispora sp. 2/2-37]CUH94690.1 hypothetical protein P22_0756 [Propionispora sp. 2/2-37]
MKKVLLVLCMLLFATSAVCSASPMPEFSLGQIALDVNMGAPNLSTNHGKVDGDSHVGYSLTVGVGLGYAGQYTYNKFKADSPLHGSGSIKSQQFYLVNNIVDTIANVSLFGGLSQTQADGGPKRSGLVVGIAGSVPVAPKTKAYGVLSAGNRLSGYEVGLSYKMTDNANFNLGYRDTKYKNITFSDDTKSDVTAKGLVGGFTLKI